MNIPFDKNSKIAIAGFGVEGEAVYRYLERHGYKNIVIFDEKKKGEKIKNIFDFDDFDIIFRSPGIHKNNPALIKARKKGKVITSASRLFFEMCPCRVIGVTGTKGKGTTSTLVYKILKEASKDAYLGGNIGKCPLGFLDSLRNDSIVVLELSSFQLHDLEKSPEIAIVLKTTSEHLDYHKDREEYLSAKESIVKYQSTSDIVIVNKDYEYSKRFLAHTPAGKLLVSRKSAVENGAFVKDNKIYSSKEGKNKEICNTDEVGLTGPHNLENILPALAAAEYMLISRDIIRSVIRQFKGLPHRLEFIKEVDGVKYYNDSFSTTPETCIAAIQSFTEPLVLIAGGSEKYADYSELGKAVIKQKNLKTIVLMGETAENIEKSIKEVAKKMPDGIKQKIIHAKNYMEAFEKAGTGAEKNGTVLFSPASASFDMFRNYKHRGETFRKWVESL
jgi:UDP-N-acetylmuramoylalanine--D-glutamate ligase